MVYATTVTMIMMMIGLLKFKKKEKIFMTDSEVAAITLQWCSLTAFTKLMN